MADKKVSQLNALTNMSGDEILALVDDPSGTPVNVRMTLQNFFANLVVATFKTSANVVIASVNFTRTGNTSLNGAVTINESGADVDFRVETSGNANTIFADGANNNVGIGTALPQAKLDVNGNSFRVRTARTPANSTVTLGGTGTFAWDSSYLYLETSTGTVKRIALSTF